MSSEEREPDSTPLTREHVEKFLQWYRGRVKVPRYLGIDDHWHHALQTLTVGELRNGIRRFSALTVPRYVEPVAFWHLCKSLRPPETERRIRQLRQTLKGDE